MSRAARRWFVAGLLGLMLPAWLPAWAGLPEVVPRPNRRWWQWVCTTS